MKRGELRQALIGGLVVLLAGLFFVYAYSGERSLRSGGVGYDVTATFSRVDGLSKGAEVRLGGIRIGGVESMRLTELKRAEVTMRIHDSIQIPTDSSAVILSDGLVGKKFIELDPGGADKMLTAGDRLRHTQGSIIIEELMELIIGQIKSRQASLAATEKQGEGN